MTVVCGWGTVSPSGVYRAHLAGRSQSPEEGLFGPFSGRPPGLYYDRSAGTTAKEQRRQVVPGSGELAPRAPG